MPTSKHIFKEASIAALACAAVALVWSPANPWLPGQQFHPGWLAVLCFAAWYGLRGLLVAAPISALMMLTASCATGAGVGGLETRLAAGTDVLPMMGAILVAVFAMLHQRRARLLEGRAEAAEARAARESDASDILRDALTELHKRNQRIDLSVGFWRQLAERIEGDDPEGAAAAAVELCMVRAGARAGMVRRVSGDNNLHTVAWQGAWSADRPVPSDIFHDRTIAHAVQTKSITLPQDVEGVTDEDSDVAVPVMDPNSGELMGVIALRGVPYSRINDAVLRDLYVSGQWLARSFERGLSRDPRQPSSGSVRPEPRPRAATWNR
jgi:hypothetical protein